MSDQQSFLLILCALYLSECLLWVRRGAVVFRSWLGRGWSCSAHSGVLANDRGDLHWQWPFPPLGTVHVVRAPPLALTPAGVLSGTGEVLPGQGRPAATGRFLAWESVKSTGAEVKQLLVNGERFWQGDSAYEPLRLARLLATLARAHPGDRPRQIEAELAAAFDRSAFEQARAGFVSASAPVRRWANALFAFLFLAAPAAVWRLGLLPTLWYLLAALVLLSAGTTRSFLKAHRRLHPGADNERFRVGLLIALAPFATVRAVDALGRAVLERFHPLTAAVALLSREQAVEFARRVWRDLKYPFAPEFPSNDPAVLEAVRWFRARELAAAEVLLKSEKMDVAAFARPLPPTEAVNVLHCERCEAQFTAAGIGCADCGGRPLAPL